MVAACFAGDLGLLARSMVDEIVTPARARLIPGCDAVIAAAIGAGALGSSISGSVPVDLRALPLGAQRRGCGARDDRRVRVGRSESGVVDLAGGLPRREARVTRRLLDLRCLDCGTTFPGTERRYLCTCGGTLDVIHTPSVALATFDARLASKRAIDRSGVWRFRELVLPLDEDAIVTKPEGNTNLYTSPRLASWVGLDALALKHEGENPTGSFKDRGMTVAISVARKLGATRGRVRLDRQHVGVDGRVCGAGGDGGVRLHSRGERGLRQALPGAGVRGPDDPDRRGFRRGDEAGSTGLRNRRRLSGQFGQPVPDRRPKAIAFELLQDRDWRVPDWLVLPGGNLGNSSAVYKGLDELRRLGLIDRLPRIAVIQAEGAAPLARAFKTGEPVLPVRNPETRATAIKIGDPVSWKKSLRGVAGTSGVVESVTDQEILDAKAHVDAAGIGAEPASCATVAGLRKLVAAGTIARGRRRLRDSHRPCPERSRDRGGLPPGHARGDSLDAREFSGPLRGDARCGPCRDGALSQNLLFF
jgi:threonine synthase